MKPLTQTRTGKQGNCFATCLASILETPLPEFGLGDEHSFWANADAWLAKQGLRYEQVPVGGVPPVGWSTIEGTSPRGGQHACVAYNGKLVHDPHPVEDDPRRGLVEPRVYGLLLPTEGAKAEDARGRRGYEALAAELGRIHNAAAKEYKVVFATVGARLWNADDCHAYKPSNVAYIANGMKERGGVFGFERLPYPLTVLDAYPDVTEKQRRWLNKEVDKIYSKYQSEWSNTLRRSAATDLKPPSFLTHAIVGYNGKPVHDPHPQDGTGRGLVEPRVYGLLLPIHTANVKDAKQLVVVWNSWPENKPYELHAEGCKDIVNRPWEVYDYVASEMAARKNRKYNPMVTKPCVRGSQAKDFKLLSPLTLALAAALYLYLRDVHARKEHAADPEPYAKYFK